MLPFRFVDYVPSYDTAEVFCVAIDPKIIRSDELLNSLYYMLWFPGYFGFNWNALYDCLVDLSWIPCQKLVLVHSVVPDLPVEELRIYLEVLRDAVLNWGTGQAHSLEVVFQTSDKLKVEQVLFLS